MLCDTPDDMITALLPNKRLLGLDIGEKTIGLGLSDLRNRIASPLETVRRTKLTGDIARLKEVVIRHDIGGLVLGYPINMDGTLGPKCQSVRQFARNIAKEIALPITFWDERMSTLAVTRTMLDADISRQKRAEHVDKLAAAYILQGFLDLLGKKIS